MAWNNCVLNISNSVIWEQIGKEDVEELTSGIAGRYENQPHFQLVLLGKDKTESREYSIPRPSTTSGDLKHAYAIFESKFIKYVDLCFLLLGQYLYFPLVPQDRQTSTHRHTEQGGSKNWPRTSPSTRRGTRSHIWDNSGAAAATANKEEGRHCSLDISMTNELNVTTQEFNTMSVHKIKECSQDPIFTATEKILQMHKPVLVMSGPVSRPHEGHCVMLAILEPDMCFRYIRERSSTSTSRNCFMSFRTITI